MKYIGWIVLAAAAIWALGAAHSIRQMVRQGTSPQRQTVNMIMLWWVGVLGVLLFRVSPFHLLWWYPVSFVAGMLSLAFPFSLLSLPGQLFGNVWCVGLDRAEIERNERLRQRGEALYRSNLEAGMSPEDAQRKAVATLKAELDAEGKTPGPS